MNNITKDVNEQIILLRKSGMNIREVAEELSITYDKAKYVLKKAGLQNYKYKRTCEQCNEEFETIRQTSRFCSDSCRGKHNKRTTLRTIRTCGHCGKKFKHYRSKYCSEECRYPNRFNQLHHIRNSRRIYRISCVGCNTTFVSKRRRKYCNKECGRKFYYVSKFKYVSKAKTHSIKCTECGKHKEVSFKRKKFCSEMCSKKYINRENYLRRERLKRLNGKIHWDISIERLMKRDGKRCYLCGGKVDIKDISVIDNNMIHGDMYPSIDHVIPLSKEGTHTWDNVRLAHRLCNSIKSDKV